MSNETIVTKEKPVQSQINPFAKPLSEHLNAGTVAIESERAIAEAQGKLVIAKRFPRDQARAYANIIDACRRPGLAEEACYSFPRGGKVVTGPSIRLAEMLAANWGNVDYGLRELSRKDGVSEMEAYCWDLETNTMSSQKFTVRHIRDRKDSNGGSVQLTDERDIYELTANMGSRRLRARIEAVIPADLLKAAVDECNKTLAGNNQLPIADRIRNMVSSFKAFGVSPVFIEARLGHPLDATLPEELAEMRKIHNSIRDGITKVADWFGPGGAPVSPEDAEQMPGDPAPAAEPVKRAPGRPRSDKGAAAVKENPAPAKTVDVEVVAEPKKENPKPEATKVVESVTAKVEEPKEEAAEQPPAQPEGRAFLKDGEEYGTEIEVVSISTLMANVAQPDGTKKLTPTVNAQVKGGYLGTVLHFGGASEVAGQEKPVANPEWAVGSRLKVVLFGKANKAPGPNFGKVQVRVQSLSVVEQPVEMEA